MIKLKPHTAINNLTVEASLKVTRESIGLIFRVKGDIEAYLFPEEKQTLRADELWKATCFELFLAHEDGEEYFELNISPSLAWNFYKLKSYRATLQPFLFSAIPTITTQKSKNCYTLTFNLTQEELDFRAFKRYNLATILLTKEQKQTFWALNPLSEKTDFHDKGSFMSRLNAF